MFLCHLLTNILFQRIIYFFTDNGYGAVIRMLNISCELHRIEFDRT